jgi:hypothetical protein
MSVSSQELLLKMTHDSLKLAEQSKSKKAPRDNFRELLRVLPTSEKPREKDFFSMVSEDKDEELKKQRDDSNPVFETFGANAPSLSAASQADAALALKSAALSPIMEAAFEKMASCMIMMSSSHETETTLILDNPHFASSSLFGTQITIREFSTAPKVFNIEILSNSAAIAAMEASKSGLLSAFQEGGFNFSVHRFDMHLQQNEDRPVLHRKENSDREQQDERKGRDHE